MSLVAYGGMATIVGPLLFLITPFITSRGIYQLEPHERVQFVHTYRGRFALQTMLVSLGCVLPSIGFVLWSLEFGNEGPLVLHFLAGASFLLGAILLCVFFYQEYDDPASYYLADKISWPGYAYFWLTVAAFVLYGILFLQTRVADWLGYLSMLVAAGMAVGIWRIGGKDLPPQPFYLVTLIAGILFLSL